MSTKAGRFPLAVARSFSIVIILTAATAAAGEQSAAPSESRIALSRTLPPMDGREVRVKIVEVTYAPGGANTAHTHPCPVIGYVLEGALRMRVNDGPETVYRAGDTFYEAPGDVHATSANASATEPARFLAYFTCDRDVAQLSSPATPTQQRQKGR
jgi:quercetin dioxygenase-like cupin family protein